MSRLPPRPEAIPRGRWSELRSALIEQVGGAPSRLEVELVNRLVLNLMYADKLFALASETPLVSGSQGQLVEHPGFRVAARCDGTALSLARRLAITGGDEGADDGESPVGVVEKLTRRRGRSGS